MVASPVLKVIAERRSVRKYTGDPVTNEDLETLVRAGMAAPSSRDTRHWYFVVINDPLVLDKLVAGLPYSKMILTARHAIVVASDMKEAHGGSDVEYWVQDCAAAVENILLAAQAIGLGACWTAAHPRAERVAYVKQTLAMPETVIPLAVIAVGHPAGEDKPRDKFDPARLFWNKFDR
ncbi:MAG: nitroreductase family protein [Candidatus Omnitrophica bacterium]|nr:nitroreductase family protein [Candidatus Omnitrophota bacterium]